MTEITQKNGISVRGSVQFSRKYFGLNPEPELRFRFRDLPNLEPELRFRFRDLPNLEPELRVQFGSVRVRTESLNRTFPPLRQRAGAGRTGLDRECGRIAERAVNILVEHRLKIRGAIRFRVGQKDIQNVILEECQIWRVRMESQGASIGSDENDHLMPRILRDIDVGQWRKRANTWRVPGATIWGNGRGCQQKKCGVDGVLNPIWTDTTEVSCDRGTGIAAPKSAVTPFTARVCEPQNGDKCDKGAISRGQNIQEGTEVINNRVSRHNWMCWKATARDLDQLWNATGDSDLPRMLQIPKLEDNQRQAPGITGRQNAKQTRTHRAGSSYIPGRFGRTPRASQHAHRARKGVHSMRDIVGNWQNPSAEAVFFVCELNNGSRDHELRFSQSPPSLPIAKNNIWALARRERNKSTIIQPTNYLT
ncbi:hypothetical protein C8J57DRAFT_1258703 [Mycena rebaudengoi]|nr:hypothetical protein C8J57DRAFT_1258703 [Mycena rebaudengoi]